MWETISDLRRCRIKPPRLPDFKSAHTAWGKSRYFRLTYPLLEEDPLPLPLPRLGFSSASEIEQVIKRLSNAIKLLLGPALLLTWFGGTTLLASLADRLLVPTFWCLSLPPSVQCSLPRSSAGCSGLSHNGCFLACCGDSFIAATLANQSLLNLSSYAGYLPVFPGPTALARPSARSRHSLASRSGIDDVMEDQVTLGAIVGWTSIQVAGLASY